MTKILNLLEFNFKRFFYVLSLIHLVVISSKNYIDLF